MAGVFKTTRDGILLYDYKLRNYISEMTTEDIVEGKLPKTAAGIYYSEMPLPYQLTFQTIIDSHGMHQFTYVKARANQTKPFTRLDLLLQIPWKTARK